MCDDPKISTSEEIKIRTEPRSDLKKKWIHHTLTRLRGCYQLVIKYNVNYDSN